MKEKTPLSHEVVCYQMLDIDSEVSKSIGLRQGVNDYQLMKHLFEAFKHKRIQSGSKVCVKKCVFHDIPWQK